MRRFNTAGPCLPAYHYMVDPIARLPEARGLVDQLGYFVVHAPRQMGKTTTLRALAEALTAEGRYVAVHFSCEGGAAHGDDIGAVERVLLDQLRDAADRELPSELQPPP